MRGPPGRSLTGQCRRGGTAAGPAGWGRRRTRDIQQGQGREALPPPAGGGGGCAASIELGGPVGRCQHGQGVCRLRYGSPTAAPRTTPSRPRLDPSEAGGLAGVADRAAVPRCLRPNRHRPILRAVAMVAPGSGSPIARPASVIRERTRSIAAPASMDVRYHPCTDNGRARYLNEAGRRHVPHTTLMFPCCPHLSHGWRSYWLQCSPPQPGGL